MTKALRPDSGTSARPLRLWALGTVLAVALGWGGGGARAYSLGCNPNGHNPHCDPGPTPTATPELGSGELLLTGLVPVIGVLLYRRRWRQHHKDTGGEGSGHVSAA